MDRHAIEHLAPEDAPAISINSPFIVEFFELKMHGMVLLLPTANNSRHFHPTSPTNGRSEFQLGGDVEAKY